MEGNPRTKNPSLWKILIPLLIILMIVAISLYMAALPSFVGTLDTRLISPRIFTPGTLSMVRVITSDRKDSTLLSGAAISIEIKAGGKNYSLFTGKSNSLGTVDASFKIPPEIPEGEGELIVKVSSSKGRDEIIEKITLSHSYRIFLSTDKPVYQPGQTIHIRALALENSNLLPLGEKPVILEIEDGKENIIFRGMDKKTSSYGIVSQDFLLADEAVPGEYKIRVMAGECESEKTVKVEKYSLPKFKIDLSTDKDFYRPKDTVKGEIKGDYFFGKAVSEGKVRIELAYSYNESFKTVAEIEGISDKEGYFEFEEYLDHWNYYSDEAVPLRITAELTDKTGHKEIVNRTIYISKNTIEITIVPESGEIVPGVENIIYLVASYPDGSPAKTKLFITAGFDEIEPESSDNGIGEFSLRPEWIGKDIYVKAIDEAGNSGYITYNTRADRYDVSLLLRPDKAVYYEGDTAKVQIFSSIAVDTVFLDIVKNNQIKLTKSVSLKDKTALIELPLPQEVFGTIQLNAYTELRGEDFIYDTGTVYVYSKKDLSLKVTPDKDTYRPGTSGVIKFEVKDHSGNPVPAALGISVVDESVFSLTGVDIGSEKVYFTLDDEFTGGGDNIYSRCMEKTSSNLSEEKVDQEIAKVAFSSSPGVFYEILVNPYPQKLFKAEKLKGKYFYCLKILLVLIVFTFCLLVIYSAFKEAARREYFMSVILGFITIIIFLCMAFVFYYTNRASTMGFETYTVEERGQWGEIGAEIASGEEPTTGEEVFVGEEYCEETGECTGEEYDSEETAFEFTGNGQNHPKTNRKLPAYLRHYFPETMYFNPELITDDKGKASIELQMADSITTWRMGVSASSLEGDMGGGDYPLKVFQDFFIEPDLPLYLTEGDEISVPVAVYNYLSEEQTIAVRVEKAEWFELKGKEVQYLNLPPGETGVVYYPIKVKECGKKKFIVHGETESLTDAIAREVMVNPDGIETCHSESGRLNIAVKYSLNIPENAIPQTYDMKVKVYPGVFSQIVEGLDSMLRMPHGCFEQTSSATYPNIMILDYMRKSGQITPEIKEKAEGYINTGYQTLLGYEVSGGGFSLYGDPPASLWLSAYGLMEFNDMIKVYPIDERLIERTEKWIVERQEGDGYWDRSLKDTAFIALALSEEGYKGNALSKVVDLIKNSIKDEKDLYTLSLMANVMVYNEPESKETKELLKYLEENKTEDETGLYWTVHGRTLTNSYGIPADIETTALVTQAFLKAGLYGDTVEKALNFIIASKSPDGGWYSTQATVLTLKTLSLAMEKGGSKESKGTVKILVDGQEAGEIKITPEDSDVIKTLNLKNYIREGSFTVELVPEGDVNSIYQMLYSYYIPSSSADISSEGPLRISVEYEKKKLKRNDILNSKVKVWNTTSQFCDTVIIELAVPAGFDVITDEFETMVKDGKIDRYERRGKGITLYLTRIEGNSEISFTYRLRAKFPLNIKLPLSEVYEYYNPERRGYSEPGEVVVN